MSHSPIASRPLPRHVVSFPGTALIIPILIVPVLEFSSHFQVILGLPYGTAIDIWSLGCILAELYTGYPLFPGENEADQLSCIMEAVGPPPSAVLEAASRRRLFFGEFWRVALVLRAALGRDIREA